MNVEYKVLASLALSVALLSGCVTKRNAEETSSHVGYERQVKFPERSNAWIKEGTFPNVENLRTLRAGMSKYQLYALIGKPHFGEGLFGPKQWNYIFNFRAENGVEIITCQYQIHFDKESLVNAAYWDRPGCKELIMPVSHAITPMLPLAVVSTPIETHKFILNSDATFPFGRANRTDILPEGREKLATLVQQLKGATVIKLRVVGYTDRLGSEAYNNDLSQRRAQTIADYLLAAGVAAATISVEGRGKSEPVVECTQKNREALIACLRPNRRVDIEVISKNH